MFLTRRHPLSGTVMTASFLLLWVSLAAAQLIAVDYCSEFNTATTPGNHSDWQTQGLCTLFCKDRKFGLAIVKKNLCWCSSILPGDGIQVSTSQCQNPCPGFPADVCGGNNTFGYMRLGANPLTATTNTGVRETSSTPAPAAPTRKPTPSIETVTVDGTVKTVTAPATPDPSDTSSESNRTDDNSSNAGGIGGGAIAGIVIGVLAILAMGGIAGFLVLRRKKRREAEAYEDPTSPRGSGAAMAHVPRSPDGGDGFGGRPTGRRPTNGTHGSDHSSGRRSSMLMPGDPRMNPSTGIYSRPDVNKSHDSFLSMQDNRDYSRPVHEPTKVLKVTNASPDDLDD